MEAVHWGTGPLATEQLATWYRHILATGHRATGHMVMACRYWALGAGGQLELGTGYRQILGTECRSTVGTGHRVSTDFNIMGHWAQKDTRNLGLGID